MTRITSKELGNAGEEHTLQLLAAKGYGANKLPVNAPTYDIEVSRGGMRFFVSVKVSRDKQHVRLGARNSVLRLGAGNFLFAYLPPSGQELSSLASPHTLLILPAAMVKEDSLAIHDAYWIKREKDPNIFGVMVKGYGGHHREMWPRWLGYRDAWHLLP
jgi:hypothetical protein